MTKIRIAVTVLVASLVLGGAFLIARASSVNLAQQSPNEFIFQAMVASAARCYSAMRDALPQTLDDLAQSGYMAYTLPAQSSVQLLPAGDHITVSSGGAVTNCGQTLPAQVDNIGLPGASPVTNQTMMLPNAQAGKMEPVNLDVENYPGGTWIKQGFSPAAVAAALKIDRVRIHLVFLAGDYYVQEGKQLPHSLQELEEFQGLERNAQAWKGITLVATPGEVDTTAGGLFAGYLPSYKQYAGPVFVVRANCGPEVRANVLFLNEHGGLNTDGKYGAY